MKTPVFVCRRLVGITLAQRVHGSQIQGKLHIQPGTCRRPMLRDNGFLIIVNAVALGLLVTLANALINCTNHLPIPHLR